MGLNLAKTWNFPILRTIACEGTTEPARKLALKYVRGAKSLLVKDC